MANDASGDSKPDKKPPVPTEWVKFDKVTERMSDAQRSPDRDSGQSKDDD